MIHDLMYIELKTGYSDDGPAWIGYVKTSKSKKTIYFNNHAFQKYNGNYSNYIDIENGDEYWISGLKKKESNRHCVFAYLKLVKNKPKTKGNDSLDDYDYGEEDSEEWETEDEEVLEDGFEGSDPNEESDRTD